VEARLAVEAVEIGVDELAVFNANPDSIEDHERARFASGMPSLSLARRHPRSADHRMLYVLGFSIAGAIVTNALVFLYLASFYPSGVNAAFDHESMSKTYWLQRIHSSAHVLAERSSTSKEIERVFRST